MSTIVEKIEIEEFEVFEPIENVIKEIDKFQPVVNLRLSIMRFMERLSFDEIFIKSVRNYKNNKADIDFSNTLKIIRNGKK